MSTQATKIHPEEEGRLGVGAKNSGLHMGKVLWGRYEIKAALGSSELGELWCCLDRESGATVSIRCLPPDMRRSKPVMAVIHAGIRRISDEMHPNVAAIRQMVYVGEQIYLVGDFAPGEDIATWGRAGAGGKRTLEDVLPVLREVAAALDFAHERKIIHRNLKPSEIYLGPDGVVRVTDFGLAPHHHLTIIRGEAVRAGTSGPYLAPELRKGGVPDSASDQYALAVLAWDLLAGEAPPPDAEPPSDLPGSARAALRRAMARTPRGRFVTCADFVKALGGARVGGRRRRSASEWRRIRLIFGTVAGLASFSASLWFGGKALSAWLNTPKASIVPADLPPSVNLPPPKAQVKAPVHKTVERLVATTPLPVEGNPWVTQTAQMEFVWVPVLQMWIGRYEVTNDEYRKMQPEHDSGDFRGQDLKGPRQPAVRLNFDDTAAYAAWLTEQERAAGKLKEGWRYRLPSSMEAVSYTRAGSTPVYPWGELWPPGRGNYGDESLGAAFSDLQYISGYQDGFPVTAPVEFSGENAWGLFGAGGNVWETTSKVAGGNQFGGWQGGGWDDHQAARLKCDMLYGFLGNARGAVNGFRLVLAPISGEAPPPPEAAAKPASAETPPI